MRIGFIIIIFKKIEYKKGHATLLNKQDILKSWDFPVCGQGRHRIFLGVTNFIKKKPLVLSLFILSFSIKGICRDDGFVKTEHGTIHYKKYGNGEPLLIINGGRDWIVPGFSFGGFLLSPDCWLWELLC
jgi:hypothetical protein